MAKYNSGFKYNDGHIYNTTILYVTIGGSVSPTSTIGHIANFKRTLASIVSMSSIISKKVITSVGDAWIAVLSILNKTTFKTVSNNLVSIQDTGFRNIIKSTDAYVGISSTFNKANQYARLIGNGLISVIGLRERTITKKITDYINVTSLFNRTATFFRCVGFRFFYNMGIRYNFPVTRNGNVDIGGSVSKTSLFKRSILAAISSSGLFDRIAFHKRTAGDANISIVIVLGKSFTKHIEKAVLATGLLAKRTLKSIAATVNSVGIIERCSQFYRSITDGVLVSKSFFKTLGKNLCGFVDPTAQLERMSTFYRNITAGVAITEHNIKRLYKYISTFVAGIGTAVKTMGITTIAGVNVLGLLRLSTSKNMHGTIGATGHFSRIGTFYRAFSGTAIFASTTSRTALFVRNVGNNFISLAGKIAKTIRKSISGIVVISRDVMKFVGNGAVHILSTLSFYKYYFLVTLDNILLPLGVKVRRESDIDSMPSVKENTAIIPGKHGEVSFGTKVGKRLLEFRVATDEMEPEEKRRYKRLIAKHFKGDTHRNLVFEDDTNKVYAVKFSGKIDPEQYPRWLDLAIPFKAASPFIESTYEKTHIGSGTALNEGTCETPLFIKITGEITNPEVTIGDITLGYTGTIPAGKTLVIDTEKLTAELDGENVLDDLTGDITVMLQPGETTVTADSNVTFIWRERWV